MKTHGNFNRICRNGAEELIPILKETFKYSYTEKPNYKKLKSILADLIRKNSEEIMMRTSSNSDISIDCPADSDSECDLD